DGEGTTDMHAAGRIDGALVADAQYATAGITDTEVRLAREQRAVAGDADGAVRPGLQADVHRPRIDDRRAIGDDGAAGAYRNGAAGRNGQRAVGPGATADSKEARLAGCGADVPHRAAGHRYGTAAAAGIGDRGKALLGQYRAVGQRQTGRPERRRRSRVEPDQHVAAGVRIAGVDVGDVGIARAGAIDGQCAG